MDSTAVGYGFVLSFAGSCLTRAPWAGVVVGGKDGVELEANKEGLLRPSSIGQPS